MTDVALRMRQCKRMGGTKLDLKGCGLTALSNDILDMDTLETLDISNNSISTLDKIDKLKNLRELTASNNSISTLSSDLKLLNQLENLRLDGNPVAVSNPGLRACFGPNVRRELNSYFGGSGGNSGSTGTPSFLGGGGGDDVSSLKKKIAEL